MTLYFKPPFNKLAAYFYSTTVPFAKAFTGKVLQMIA